MKALVTGASSGIGRDMARNLAIRGYDLILVARSENKLKELAEEVQSKYNVNAKVIPMDISIEEKCKELHECEPDVDILINNARIWGLWFFCKNRFR